jgi:lipopolysaccharide/colanic/teichoic acid biosynthesis glycosyltransferase
MEDGFYTRRGKRTFDFILAAIGLVLLIPLLLVVIVLVKITSQGPVFYRQDRVGQGGRIFRIAKFRSMFDAAGKHGPVITSAGDRRITPVGRLLRHSKVDELPQLWNVLRGDMSLVGPRPEVPPYVESYLRRSGGYSPFVPALPIRPRLPTGKRRACSEPSWTPTVTIKTWCYPTS